MPGVEDEEGEGEQEQGNSLYHVRMQESVNSPPIEVKISVDDCLILMEADT